MDLLPYTSNPGERRMKTPCGRYAVLPPRIGDRWLIVSDPDHTKIVSKSRSLISAAKQIDRILDREARNVLLGAGARVLPYADSEPEMP